MWKDDEVAALERQLVDVKRERAFNATIDRQERRSRLRFIALGTVLAVGGAAAWAKGMPYVGMFAIGLGLAFTLAEYIPVNWLMTPRITKHIRWLRRRPTSPSQADHTLTQLVALAPVAAGEGDYGPNGARVARLIALVESLTPPQWEALEATAVRSAERWLAESRRVQDRELAAREESIQRQIARRRESPWDTASVTDESESDWMWSYLTALRRLAIVRVGQEPPPRLALIPVRRAIKALVRRGSIDESEFFGDWGPFREAVGAAADDVFHS